MPEKETAAVIIIGVDGVTRHLVDHVSERIAEAIGPKVSTQRSSHIESWRDLSMPARRWILEHNEYIGCTVDRVYVPQTRECPGEDLTNHFWADLLPVGGPVLGPYIDYDGAHAAEIKYLQEQDLPCPLEAPIQSYSES